MTSFAKCFLLFLSTFLDARQTFSSTRTRSSFLALLLGTLVLFAATPVSAAVLVSNIGQTSSVSQVHFLQNTGNAQGFTAGDNSAGYSLTSIELKYHTAEPEPSALQAELWSSTNGAPGSKLADLTVPATVGVGNVSFAASGVTLSANTSYFFVLKVGARTNPATTGRAFLTTSTAEDSGAGSGWSIGDARHWYSGNPPFASGTSNLQIRVNGEERPPTVSLSVSPNSVLEGSGSFVHLTVRLSRVLTSDVSIPLTATPGSAESGDYEILYSAATISAGNLSVSGAYLLSNQDDDEDDETLTVALGTLPSTVTAGTPSSVEITIRDDDGQVLSVEARPACGTTVTGTSFFLRPERSLVLMPAPDAETEAEVRAIPGGPWKQAVSIRANGQSGFVSNLTFAELRELFPGFEGYEFRLKDTPGITVRCTWTFLGEPPSDPDPMPPDTTTETPTNTGGTGTGGGGSPPRDTPSPDDDPTPDSARCEESDEEYLEKFYVATGGENWLEKEYWNSEEPLDQWFGVGTDEDGEVISLRLSDNNLSGDMPTEELLCLNENTELKELALWDNEDLLGEVPEDLALAVERAALRAIAEMLNLNPEWFEDYEDPFNFEDWHEGVTTDDDGRVVELVLPGEIPESIISQFKERREITITTSDGGCALSPEGSSASGLFFLTLVVFAVLGRRRARS